MLPWEKLRGRARRALPFVALLSLVAVAYVPAYRAGYVWDDGAMTENMLLRSPGGLLKIWTEPSANVREAHYWPLVYSVFWLNFRMWGLNAVGYHVQNVLLHAINAILLFLILRRLAVPGAWFAAALFAVHPVRVESVAWVIELKDVLSGFLYLSSFHLFLRFHRETASSGARPLAAASTSPLAGEVGPPQADRVRGMPARTRRAAGYTLSLILFAAAMLSKSVAVSLPCALLLCLWWQQGRLSRRDLASTVPYFVVALAMAAVDLAVARQADPAAFGLTGLQRMVVAGRSVVFYLGKLIRPVNLMAIYPRWDIASGTASQLVFPVAVVLLLCGCAAWARRGSRAPLAALLFFVVTLGPTLGFIDHGFMSHSFVADRFQYLASIGPIALFAAGMARLGRRLPVRLGQVSAAVPAVLLVLLGTGTWQHAATYRDMEALSRHNLEFNPAAWMAHHNLGYALEQQGRPDAAIVHYRRALGINAGSAIAHNNLGNALRDTGQHGAATVCYRRALELDPREAMAHNNWGNLLRDRDKPGEAIAHYRAALEINPLLAAAHSNWGNALLDAGTPRDAIGHYLRATAIDPALASAHNNMGRALDQLGRTNEAISSYRRAIALAPGFALAHSNLGKVLRKRGDVEGAVAEYARALAIDPACDAAHYNWANVLRDQGRNEEAIQRYERALETNPEFALAHNNLANVLLRAGRAEEAIGHYAEAVRLGPANANIRVNQGTALEAAGELERAIASYRGALAINPDHAAAGFKLGVVLARLGQSGEAIQVFRDAAQRTASPAAYLNLGILLQGTGGDAEAERALRKGLELAAAAGDETMVRRFRRALIPGQEAVRAGNGGGVRK